MHEQARLGRLGEVAVEGRQPPLAGKARLAPDAAVPCFLDEAEGDEFLEGPRSSVLGEFALVRGVPHRESQRAVVLAKIARSKLDVDGARLR